MLKLACTQQIHKIVSACSVYVCVQVVILCSVYVYKLLAYAQHMHTMCMCMLIKNLQVKDLKAFFHAQQFFKNKNLKVSTL